MMRCTADYGRPPRPTMEPRVKSEAAAAAEGAAPDVPASSRLWMEDSDCVLERVCDGRYGSCCLIATSCSAL